MIVLRFIVGAILLVVSVWLIAMNWWIVIERSRKGRRSSLAPFYGGICGALALLLIPSSKLAKVAWVPLVIDVGCLPILIAAAIAYFKRRHHALN